MATNVSKDVEAGYNVGAESPPPAYDQYVGEQTGTNTHVPPTYSATAASNDMAPPPSYDSLYGKVKAAKAGSEGNVDFCKKFFVILCGTIGCTIMLAVVMAIPVAMIVMGAIHKDDCPAERMIPIYLIVGGSFGIVKNLSSLLQRCKNKDEEDGDEKNAKTNPFDATLNCFLFAWFIAGNVWVYRTKDEWTSDSMADNYCDPSLYWFAFWLITSTYILLGCICCCVCFGGIMAACCGALENK
ncbi:transmembrane protein 272-like [Mercenaria mercenaria]|uniref:transmembrane protein 272-like n=1 Tax=Mercenaria mercenaria TaxID=6596 RepID=UPI001E1DF20E|nr:transmembrane protein 272-like [Mercenaria mercenaria]